MSVHKDEQTKGKWYVIYKGKKKRGFKTRRDAENYEAKLKLGLVENQNVESVWFHDLIQDYLSYLKENNSYGTYVKCKGIMEHVVIPNTANKKISKVSSHDCRKFRSYIQSLDYSTYYKNYILNKYKAVFKHGREFFKLKEDPSVFLKPYAKSYDEKKRLKEKEMQIWSVDDFGKFISKVKKEEYKALFTTIYFTGMRLGEALALTWNDITEDKVIHITKSITRKTEKGTYEVKEPKTSNSIRDISTGDNLYEYLMKYKDNEMKIPGFKDEWYIFGRLHPLPQTSIDHVKEKAINDAGVIRITIHQMRHSHPSYLINNDINIVSVSKRLGHTDVSMTLRVYTHLFKDIDKQLIDFVDKTSVNLFGKLEDNLNKEKEVEVK